MKKKSILNTTVLLVLIGLSNYVHAAQEQRNCTKKVSATIAAFLMATVVLHVFDHASSPATQPYVCDTSDVCAPADAPYGTVHCAIVKGKQCYNREQLLTYKEDGTAHIVYSQTAHCPGTWKPLKEYEESRQKKKIRSKHQIRFSGPKNHTWNRPFKKR